MRIRDLVFVRKCVFFRLAFRHVFCAVFCYARSESNVKPATNLFPLFLACAAGHVDCIRSTRSLRETCRNNTNKKTAVKRKQSLIKKNCGWQTLSAEAIRWLRMGSAAGPEKEGAVADPPKQKVESKSKTPVAVLVPSDNGQPLSTCSIAAVHSKKSTNSSGAVLSQPA